MKFSCAFKIKWKIRYHVSIKKTFILFSKYRPHFYKPHICCTSNGKHLTHCYTRYVSRTIYLMSALSDGLTTPSLIFLHLHLCWLCFVSTLKGIKSDTLQNHKHHHGKKFVFLQSAPQSKFISKSLYLENVCLCWYTIRNFCTREESEHPYKN